MPHLITSIIVRMDTSSPFFYDHFNLSSNPEFIRLISLAKAENLCILDSIDVSSDNLKMFRTMVWTDQQSFITHYQTPWLAMYPTYYTDLDAYCLDHLHTLYMKGFDL